jgi:hypothetical protein
MIQDTTTKDREPRDEVIKEKLTKTRSPKRRRHYQSVDDITSNVVGATKDPVIKDRVIENMADNSSQNQAHDSESIWFSHV